ncbi:MAG: TlpA disulfide reductase family protein [Mucilaginibacter sp.]|uniref:TlpA family protein disulfide reductase n=1 Tax=Mucilaginibacter sp. TaxID=1882438 RepID=UPI0031A5CBAD
MNKLVFSIVLGLFAIPAFGQYQFRLEIYSKSLSEKKVFLNIFNNHDHVPIKADSVVLKDGHGILTGQLIQSSNFAAFNILDEHYVETYFVLDSGKNIVQLELPINEHSRGLNINSNSRGNTIYDDLNKIFTDQVDRSPTPARVNGYIRVPLALMDQITAAQMQRLAAFPADYAALLYLYRMGRLNDRVDQAKYILNTLAGFDESIRYSALGKELYKEKSELISTKHAATAGNDVPFFKVNDINNKPFSNRSLLGQNYLIVFSATWCGPCQLQLPKLKKLYQDYNSLGLKVIYFNIDDNVTRWREHVTTNRLKWINVSERLKASESKIQKSFGVYSIPTCLIVNKQGKIIYNSDDGDPGIDHIQSFLKTLMN